MFLLGVIFGFVAVSFAADTRLYYKQGWNANKVAEAKRNNKGDWTVFLNADSPLGTGEFEDVWRLRTHYRGDCRALWCRQPVAMEVGLSPVVNKYLPNAKFEDAMKCTNLRQKEDLSVSQGFSCKHVFQRPERFPSRPADCVGENGLCKSVGMRADCSRCFDAKARYFCLHDTRECQQNSFPHDIP